MAFLIYKKTDAGTNIRYERIKPLKLGGSDGLIARHVKSLPADQTHELETGCRRTAQTRWRRR